jgi:hypothetical protein
VYAFSPDHLTVYQGDTLDITIVNPEDDPHTFVLSDFNVNVLLPPQAATKVHFVANKVGVFTNAAQDAPVFEAGEEWASLIWGWGMGGTFGYSSFFSP